MQKFILHEKYRIHGYVSFEGLSYRYLDKKRGEMLEFKLLRGDEFVFLRFYSGIISFRHRDVHGASDYERMERAEVKGNALYVVENSEYIKELNRTSCDLVGLFYSPMTHYVVFDHELEYYFDIVTNEEPEIIIEKIE